MAEQHAPGSTWEERMASRARARHAAEAFSRPPVPGSCVLTITGGSAAFTKALDVAINAAYGLAFDVIVSGDGGQ